MATVSQLDAQQIGQVLAKTIRDDAAVRGVYVQAVRDYVDVWILTEPIDIEAEDRFYEAGAALQRAFPEAIIRFHLINPRLFASHVDLPDDVIPSGAIAIPVHA